MTFSISFASNWTFALLVTTASLGASVPPAMADAEGDRRSWEGGIVTVVGNDKCSNRDIGDEDVRKNCLGANAVGGKVPAVIFLHGCAGINTRQMNVMGLFVQAGYTTFMPDSMARSERSSECGSAADYVHLRFDDINYALSRIREIPWIDDKRLVLAGFSAGGLGAAEFLDFSGVFKARVILGWGCRGESPLDTSRPYLNLVGAHDGETSRGNQLCAAVGDSAVARHVSSGHDVSEDSASARIIGDFLKKALDGR